MDCKSFRIVNQFIKLATINKKTISLALTLTLLSLTTYQLEASDKTPPKQKESRDMIEYYFPAEDKTHEGTWLTWPHHYSYGREYRDEIENIWIEIAYALHERERVHIVAYNEAEKNRITKLLELEEIDMSLVDFVIAKSDDSWIRDTGPIFVLDNKGKATIVDFAFDGWGRKTPYKNDDAIPVAVAQQRAFPIVSVSEFVLEGGSVELDGSATAMLCKSSVVSRSRNPDMNLNQAEQYLSKYLGVTNFIWLDGVEGEDITDSHIDGTARFYDDKTIVTVSEEDFFELYEGVKKDDYKTLQTAKNARGEKYKIITLPMSKKNVKGMKIKGSYLNYYVANDVVLLPVYDDINDAVALETLAKLYTGRKIIPIDVTSLYKHGGMLHCITQQQP